MSSVPISNMKETRPVPADHASSDSNAAVTAVIKGGRKNVVAARVAVSPEAGTAEFEPAVVAGLPARSPASSETSPASGEARPAGAGTSIERLGEPRDERLGEPRDESVGEPPRGEPDDEHRGPGGDGARRGEPTGQVWPDHCEAAQRSLERRIRAHLTRAELTITLTDNRYTMISVRRGGKESRTFRVRLHHMFVHASPMITRSLARYIACNDREASKILGEFIDANQHHVRTSSGSHSAPRMVTQGRIHDLQQIYDHLNRRYFNGTIDADITWGKRLSKPRRRNSIKMGSYSVEDRLIRIHRSLDRPFVPRFFIEWVVFHEMLHQVHDIKVVNGRRRFHSREFLRDEATFEFYAESRAWERANLDALLTC